jgi:hypothetical protein
LRASFVKPKSETIHGTYRRVDFTNAFYENHFPQLSLLKTLCLSRQAGHLIPRPVGEYTATPLRSVVSDAEGDKVTAPKSPSKGNFASVLSCRIAAHLSEGVAGGQSRSRRGGIIGAAFRRKGCAYRSPSRASLDTNASHPLGKRVREAAGQGKPPQGGLPTRFFI